MMTSEHSSPYINSLDSPSYYSDMYGGQFIMNGYPNNRTVYLGNIPTNTSVSDIIDHVKTGPIQAIRPLPEKNILFITFIDPMSANQFFYEAQTSKLSIHGNELKIGWGKPSTMSGAIQEALKMGATRNVYLGALDDTVTENDLRQDLSRFGHIEHIKFIPEKKIAFVHFLSISNAINCVNTLPTETKWKSNRINYGKDRSNLSYLPLQKFVFLAPNSYHSSSNSNHQLAYDMYTGLPIMYHHQYTPHHQHQLGVMANRTIYLGNIHPDTTTEDICNVIRGGILSQIRYMPDKHIAFLTFVDPQAASVIVNQCIVIKSRRLKIGWGKPSALPPNVIDAVQNGGSRNVYVGNMDDSMTEEKLKHDFSEYGEIELVNTLKEKNCAFVNFTSIAGAIRAIDGIRSKEEYKKFRINYGKDRCGNPPRSQQNQLILDETVVFEGEEYQSLEPYVTNTTNTNTTNTTYSTETEPTTTMEDM